MAMKVIRLTYRVEDIEPSVYLLLFFRLAGIYMYERFWGELGVEINGFELPNDIQLLRPPVFSDYDCDIFLVKDDNDRQKYEMLPGRKPEKEVLLAQDGLCPDAISIGNGGIGLLQDILNDLFNKRIIDSNEKKDLDGLAQIYVNNKLTQLTLRAKYFFTANEEPQIEDIIESYEGAITALTGWMQDQGCQWGDRKLFYTQYAALHMIYELNCFCLRYRRTMEYNRESLIRLCDLLDTGLDGLLGDSVRMLKGQTYDDLFFDANKAYECYVDCCNDKTAYNSYVYFRKGNYWQEAGDSWENALQYYMQAVYIYPEYYRAWYKIGLCYQNLNMPRDVVTSYENVRKCLSGRISSKCVRPMEIEHVFKAQMQIADIWEANGNPMKAIKALEWAERAWDSIGETSFYGVMCGTDEKLIDFYRAKTRENLNIDRLCEKMIVLYTGIGEREKALQYREKFGR